MKKTIICFALLAYIVFPKQLRAQIPEVKQLLLNVEKLAQFKKLLQDMKTGYKILDEGYSTIRDISKGNFTMHKSFLDGLLNVSPAVRNYRRIGEIITDQETLIREYRQASLLFRRDQNFSEKELTYIESVYTNLFRESVRNLDELAGIITAGRMRMSDDERLKAIDRIYFDMRNKLDFIRKFNGDTKILAIQRAKQRNDIKTMRTLYGIKD